ncbi:YgiW/YdeI family stress tolerance OB fold protein [Vibrio furnissii]|uniref:YgiW/YdeI family stress tolerance OB fold protein n=1 Tax=Vibrio furnissii TaxID=29494 RepID=UPI0001B93101|nr:NirD/YgiW/YdeI family stress tolerance protein [Vibrio furnissii]EEX39668.1 hypothetical protein VFA_002202 [Vibrio furnissii CIP 102972]QDC94411.1 NirD/YgiW/YdeI family stress tolerance protein [Vibrio furnissii]UON49851.1 NirD/YgiW/YdeI family stress tolerance protein [Vibrio furnissii]SUQ33564.1 protein ygiW [Vibrio furnissii]
MKKSNVLFAASALILAPTLAFAGEKHHGNTVQFNGPVEVTSVQSLLDESTWFGDKDVVVEGHLLRQVRKDTFVFSDGNTEIQVELDDDIILKQPLDPQTKVRLYGEFENGRTPEIEVDHIQLL